MLEILLSPFSYLRVKDARKLVVDWVVPLYMAFFSTLIFFFAGEEIATAGLKYLANIYSFAAILPGFYIAALTAVVTFDRPGLDELITPPTPTILVRSGVHWNAIDITRRKFVAYIFSFLSAESLVLCVFCLLSQSIFEPIFTNFILGRSLAILITALASLLFWQLLTVTFFGLYYIGDKFLRF